MNKVLRDELKKLLEQCEKVHLELNAKRGSDIFDSLHHGSQNVDIYDVYVQPSVPSVTTIPADNKEWRKLVNGVQAFLRLYNDSLYQHEFQGIFEKAAYGVTDRLLDDAEVLISDIDNDLTAQELKGTVMQSSEQDENGAVPKMIFISHSGKDAAYMEAFVELLQYLGFREEDVICTSVDGFGIPLGENIYKWLVEKFQKYELHVIYALSRNYYNSPACLNEMGAAWAMKQKWDGMLLPGFDFKDVAGCIDDKQITLKLDAPNVNHVLGELKNQLIVEFGLRAPSPTGWEKHRDAFVKKVAEISAKDDPDDNLLS